VLGAVAFLFHLQEVKNDTFSTSDTGNKWGDLETVAISKLNGKLNDVVVID
jgi:hypothetical protein